MQSTMASPSPVDSERSQAQTNLRSDSESSQTTHLPGNGVHHTALDCGKKSVGHSSGTHQHHEQDLSDLSNEQVAELWAVGTPFDAESDFTEVSFDVACMEYKDYMSAAHAMLFARDDTVLWQSVKVYANILMQMRFDGNLGFPGGIIDAEDFNPVDGLNRELMEEMNIGLLKINTGNTECLGKSDGLGNPGLPSDDRENARLQSDGSGKPGLQLLQSDHVISHVNHKKKLVTHFYAHEISGAEFREVERLTLDARDWGSETLGIVRVPLYVIAADNARGFPVFLANRFAGNARSQLLTAIRQHNILSKEELDHVLECYQRLIERN